MNTQVTVIVVNYFSSHGLKKLLASMQPNDCFRSLDIHIVDNSCDVSEAAAIEQLAGGYPVTTHVTERNLGFGGACNLVYQQTHSPFVLLVNPDAFFIDDAIDRLYRFMLQNPRVAAVGPKTWWSERQRFVLPPSITFSPLDFFIKNYPSSLVHRLLCFYSFLWRRSSIRYWQAIRPLRQKNLSGGCVMLKRGAVDQSGGLFDPGFFMYFEDTDLFRRLAQRGFQLFYLPAAGAVHEFGGSERSRNNAMHQNMQKSQQYYFDKHYPGNRLIRLTQAQLHKKHRGWKGETGELGSLSGGESLEFKLDKGVEYLIEWSPLASFIPAAGLIYSGESFRVKRELWSIMPTGHNFLRIAPLNKVFARPSVWHWIKQV